MTPLSYLLLIKILGTIILVSIPFLFFSQKKIEALTQSKVRDTTLFRLYGMSVTAILVGYGFGLAQTIEGVFPFSTVVMGIVSNSGASAILFYTGAWKNSKVHALFFSTIAFGLTLSVVFPETLN